MDIYCNETNVQNDSQSDIEAPNDSNDDIYQDNIYSEIENVDGSSSSTSSTSSPSSTENFQIPNSNIELLDYQIEPYKTACDILMKEFGYLDTSQMGSGKTVLTLAVAATFQYKLIVICSLSLIAPWKKEAEKYGVEILHIMTYDTLRGSTRNPPKHNLCRLNKVYNEGQDEEKKENMYIATKYFRELCVDGILLIIDEVHKVKNEATSSLKAVHSLVRCVVDSDARSRIALLGETPVDKPEYTPSICKLLGIVRADKMYTYNSHLREYIHEGILELIEKAKSYDENLTEKVVGFGAYDKVELEALCHNLYVEVIKSHVSFGMTPPPNCCQAKKICRNAYYDMNDVDVEKLREGVSMLSNATRYRSDTNSIGTVQSFPAVMKALTMIEHSKVNTSIRLARQTLNDNPQAKVLLFFSFIEDMKRATDKLKEFNPMLMYGSTSTYERTQIEERFQKPSKKYRLLISNPSVGGIGLNLDDRDGSWPRFMFIIPSFHFINLHQCTGRIYRPATTKSDAKIFFIYSKEFPHETSILDSLLKKANTLRSIRNHNEENTPLPGEYIAWIEGEGDCPTFTIPRKTKIIRARSPSKENPKLESISKIFQSQRFRLDNT